MKKVLVSLALVGLISGCNGSSSSDSTSVDPGDSNSNTPDENTANENLVAVSGVYNTSRTDDEAYLYISTSGAVTAYDYQGDISGTGDNCYSISTEPSQINSSLNSGMISFSSADNKYTITNEPTVLAFSFDTTDGMHNFSLNSGLGSGTGLDIRSANVNIKVGGDGNLQSNLEISDIESALCN